MFRFPSETRRLSRRRCQSTNNEARPIQRFAFFFFFFQFRHSTLISFLSLSLRRLSQLGRPAAPWSPIRDVALSGMWSRQVNTLPPLPSVGERTAPLKKLAQGNVCLLMYIKAALREALALLVAPRQRAEKRRSEELKKKKMLLFSPRRLSDSIFERWSFFSFYLLQSHKMQTPPPPFFSPGLFRRTLSAATATTTTRRFYQAARVSPWMTSEMLSAAGRELFAA